MPLRTLRYVLVQADTRAIEVILAFAGFTWGFVILGPANVLPPNLRYAIQQYSSTGFIGVAGICTGIGFALGILFQYPRWRWAASLLSSLFWTYLCLLCVLFRDAWFTAIVSGTNAIIALWLLSHKQIHGAEGSRTNNVGNDSSGDS